MDVNLLSFKKCAKYASSSTFTGSPEIGAGGFTFNSGNTIGTNRDTNNNVRIFWVDFMVATPEFW